MSCKVGVVDRRADRFRLGVLFANTSGNGADIDDDVNDDAPEGE